MAVLDAFAARAPLAILAASMAVLAGAYGFEYLGGLAPCELCLFQRIPYAVAIVLSGAAQFVPPAVRRWLVGGCALAFAAGLGLAAYHVGVEQGAFAGPTACTGGDTGAATVEALRRQLEATQLIRCDEVQWTLFGVSLAGYNVLISAALAAFALFAARRKEGP
jgi:disulfide bond formation protein DsbB